MKNILKLFGFIALVAIIGLAMIACDNGTPSDNGTPGDPGPITYVSYDESGNRYTLVVTQIPANRSAFTPQGGDTYTLEVEGMGWGTSTGTVTSFSSNNYVLSNNDTALNLAVSNDAISSIAVPIVYDEGEHSQMSDGTKTPHGSMDADSPLFGTWGTAPNALTITAAGGWTFSNSGQNYSGTYTIAETMSGIPHYILKTGGTQQGIAHIKPLGWDDGFPVVEPDKIVFTFDAAGITDEERARQ
jgi:hypothetical protein